jgi:hypothetical protein
MVDQIHESIKLVKRDCDSHYKSTQSSIKVDQGKIKELNKFKDESRIFEESVIK